MRPPWPEGIYGRLSKHVVTFASQKKHVLVREHEVLDQAAIFDRVICLLVCYMDLNVPHILSTELAAYALSMFHPDESVRLAIDKSMLKKNFALEVA